MTERRALSFALPDILDINAAAKLAKDIVARRGTPLGIDASRVQKLDALCLQVLLSARATWATDKVPFFLQAPSHAFRDAVGQFGASALLNQPTALKFDVHRQLAAS